MLFQFNFYSSILLIFWVNILIYTLLLIKKGIENQHNADKWLSFFLGLCTLYITPWMVGFAGWYDRQPYRDILFYTPFQHLFWMGPAIFFYVQSLLNSSFKFEKKDLLHFLPGFLYLIYSLIMVVTDKIILGKYYFLADGQDRDLDAWYQWTGLFSMLLYFVATIRYYNVYKKWIVEWVSYADEVLFNWVKNFLFAFLSMQMFQVLFQILSQIFPKLDSYVGSWWYFLAFAIVSYYIAITGYANSVQSKIRFKVNLLAEKEALLLTESNPKNEELMIDLNELQALEEKVDDSLIAEWKPKLLDLMQKEKAFENPELSLTQVAKLLGTNPSLISRVVNQGFQQNFNDFVNQYRIEAVKIKFQQGEHQKQTLIGIAYDCGFNSKATFNRAFKKITGQTPKDFIDALS